MEDQIKLTKTINTIMAKMHASADGSLNKHGFYDPYTLSPSETENIIQEMLRLDLIEIETDPDIFFLTYEGYLCFEDGGLYIPEPKKHQKEQANYKIKANDLGHEQKYPVNWVAPGLVFFIFITIALSYSHRNDTLIDQESNINYHEDWKQYDIKKMFDTSEK